MFFIRHGPTSSGGSFARDDVPRRKRQSHDPSAGGHAPAAARRRKKIDRLADELLADPKERAEHIMLVDLGRNDVGRVAEFGSVRIGDLMTVERYSHVMHLSQHRDRPT